MTFEYMFTHDLIISQGYAPRGRGIIPEKIKKIFGVKEILTAIVFTLNTAFFIALSTFIVSIVSLLVNLNGMIKNLFDKSTSGTIAGHDALNDYNSIAWSALHSYGVIDVFNTFLPLILSTFTIYFTLFGTRILLDYKRKMINALQEATMML
jgi:hypothetical protein